MTTHRSFTPEFKAWVCLELGKMLTLDALLMHARKPPMAGHFLPLRREDEQLLRFGGFDQQRLARMGQRHGVAIALKMDQALATGPAGRDDTGIDGTWQRQRSQALLWQACERHLAGGAMHALVGDSIEPGERLGIDVRQIAEMQPDPEIVAHILDAAFDFAFGLRPIGAAELRTEAHHIGKIQKGRVPVDRAIGPAREYDALKIVVE